MPTTNALNRVLTKCTPEMFGRYHLLGRIAIGGMAEVYVARCGELMGMQTLIALKRILPVHAADAKFIQMFQREASIALRLQHRAIARVYEVGKVADDWFLSLELVQGENLARVTEALTERGLQWDPNLVAFIGAEVAQALHYAHTLQDARGRDLKIVHRDVSPENVMLGFDGSVKVIDFGIALCESYASLTTQGAVRGKVQYVSPEQAQTHKLDGRSDVFSLGVVLYECLAGAQPFERTSPMATLEAVVNKWVPPIPHVPPALNEAIIKALEKEPGKRYRDAQEFSFALLSAISGQDTASGPTKVAQLATALFPERLKRWRQIQEMAIEGFGFAERPPSGPGLRSEQETRAEPLVAGSADLLPPPSPATPPPERRTRRGLGAVVALATAAVVLVLLVRVPGSLAPLTDPQAATVTTVEAPLPRVVPLSNAPLPAPPPVAPPETPAPAEAAPEPTAAEEPPSRRKKAKRRSRDKDPSRRKARRKSRRHSHPADTATD